MTPLVLNPEPAQSARTPGQIHCVDEAMRSRDLARGLLRSLIRAKAECDRYLAEHQRSDAMEAVRGHSSFDDAIDDTRKMIEQLDGAIDRLQPRG